jgi:DNA repair protein RecN (Recombination protein N)
MILEYLLCQINHAQILIFDEIDNGISGYTTHLLSKKLQEKAQDFQVIVITHSAILSAYANNHYKIEKIQKDNKTSTFIKLLDEDMRIREIAYMMSGSTISASALDQASELLKNKKET